MSSHRSLHRASAGIGLRKTALSNACRSAIEPLERRVLLAAIAWTGGSGFWDDVSHWDLGRKPVFGDDVTIAGSGITVTVRNANERANSLNSAANLAMDADSSLRVDGASTLGGSLSMAGGTLTLGGASTLAGSLNWTGGTLAPTGGLTANGAISINSSTDVALHGDLVINSTLTQSNVGNLLLNNNTDLTINGSYAFTSDAGMGFASVGGGAIPNILLVGTLTKSGGTGTSTIAADGLINLVFQGGDIQVQSGNLTLTDIRGTSSTTTDITVASGSTLLFSSPIVNWAGTINGTGTGSVQMSDTAITAGTGGLTFNFAENQLQWLGGAIFSNSSNPFTNAGAITLAGADDKTVGVFLNNAGHWTHGGSGRLIPSTSGGATTFNNLSGATYDFSADAENSIFSFNNAGLVRKAAGTGHSNFTGVGGFHNEAGGVVQVLSGKLVLEGGSTFTGGGNFNIAADSVLEFAGTHFHNFIGGTYTNTGLGIIHVIGPFEGDTTTPATFNFTGGALQVDTFGQLWGEFTNAGTINLVGNDLIFVRAIITNTGAIYQFGNTTLQVNANSQITNQGLYEILGDGHILMRFDLSFGNPPFKNTGILRKSGGAGTSRFGHETSAKGTMVLDNTGTVEVRSGTLAVEDPVSQISGTALQGGTWVVGASSTLTLPANLTASSGNIVLEGAGATLGGLGSSSFTNGGQLTLGPASSLNVSGDFVQMSGGTLAVQVAGPPASGQFGTMTVSGSATLAGTFVASAVGGFGPSSGQLYTVLSASAISGAFAAMSTPPELTPSISSNAIVLNGTGNPIDLTVTGVTPPSSGQPGAATSIGYTVQNLESDTASSGTWIDSLYLSKDSTFDSSDVLIGRVTHAGGVAAGGSYSETFTGPLPVAPDGDYHVIVLADSRGLVSDADRTNNFGASSGTTAMSLPSLTLGATTNGSIDTSQDVYYVLSLQAGQDVLLNTNFSVVRQGQVYVRYNALPDTTHFDLTNDDHAALGQTLLLHATQTGNYFVLVHGIDGAAGGQAFNITPTLLAAGATSVAANHGSNLGSVTVTISGSGFNDSTTATLALGGASRAASSVQFVDGNTLFATFDLTNLPEGAYDLLTNTNGVTATLGGAFTVNSAPVGVLDFSLAHPSAIRAGTQATLTLEYINRGETDLLAPLFIVSTDNGRFRLSDQTGFVDDYIEVLGINHSGPAGVLPPGARGTVTIQFEPKVVGSHVFSNFTVNQAPRNMTMDWSALKDDLRPAGLASDAWNAIYANFMSQIGTTSGQYADVLRENATYLSQFGTYTHDPSQLLGYELFQASNFGEISRRYSISAFGRGQADPFDLRAQTDAAGNVTISVGGRGRSFLRQADGSYVGEPGERGTLTRDGSGAYTVREATGEITLFQPDGKLNFLQTPDGNRVTANYTGSRLTSLVASNGDTTTFTYNSAGRITQITDAVGRTAVYAYDASNEHLTSITTAAGTVSISYVTGAGPASEHAIASITQTDGTHDFFQYDALGRLIHYSRDGGALPLTIAYDSLGNGASTDALGNVQRVMRDASNRLARIQDGQGNLAGATYDSNFRQTGLSLPGGLQETIDYDSRGNVINYRDAAGNAIGASFDPTLNRLLSLTTPRGDTTSFAYDLAGNLTGVTDPAGHATSFVYNAQGQPTSITSGVGTVTYTYDAAGLITRKSYSDGTHVDYTYDAHRNLLTATDESGTVSFTYNSADRITSVAYPGGLSLMIAYDAFGRRVATTDQSGFTTRYEYDSLSRLAAVKDTADATLASYSYDALGRLSRIDNGNGTFTTYAYDNAGSVTSVVNHAPGGAVSSQFDYTYDALGRRATMTTSDGTTTYIYDPAGQLTKAVLPGGRTITYEYDANGNRTSVSDTGATTTNYSTNNLDQYTSAGSATFLYDNDGNLVARGGSDNVTYVYNARGQLISTTSPGDTFVFAYDALGNRVSVTHNGVTTRQLIDPGGLGNVVGEFNTNGDPLRQYAYGIGLVSQTVGGAWSFYDFDANGNTAALTAANGAVLNSYSYLPFGQTLTTTGSAVNPFTFGGALGAVDAGDGLYFMRTRSYDAGLGRFIQRDRLGFLAGDPNLYRYAQNDPINSTDASGMISDDLRYVLDMIGEFAYPETQMTVAEASKETVGQLKFRLANNIEGEQWIRSLVQQAKRHLGEAGFATYQEPGMAKLADVAVGGLKAHAAEREVLETALGQVERQAGKSLLQRLGLGGLGAGLGGGLRIASGGPASILITEIDIWNQQMEFQREFPEGDPVPVQEVINGPKYQQTIRRPLVSELLKRSGGDVSQDTLLFNLKLQSDLERIRAGRPIQPLQQVTSTDPNDIIGPAGFGDAGFIAPDLLLPYTINFQNKPDASAPAQGVTITQTLDSDLDLSTFAFGDMGFGSTHISVPPNRQTFTTQVALNSSLRVEISANLDVATRTVTWTFTSIDPNTGDIPIDPFSGFLPPDAIAGQGQGFVSYTARAAAASPTGTVIDAQASIVFDNNAPLATPPVFNTIDIGAPASAIVPLPAQISATYVIQASGADDAGGSGVGFYDFYVSTDGGPFERFASAVPASSTVFHGVTGHTYGFYSIATDNVGNVEPAKSAAETTASVVENFFSLIPDPSDSTRQALFVSGSSAPDRIQFLRLRNGQIRLIMNGVDKGAFAVTGSIIAHGGGGNDSIVVAPNITLPTNLDGGDGNDYLVGARGSNVLTGGEGNDILIARGAANQLDGGNGNDRLTGGPGGLDTLVGGAGDDRLTALGRNNLLDGGDGDDFFYGYQQNIFLGGAGNDRIVAGAHNLLIGGLGGDRLSISRGSILIAGRTTYDQDRAALRAVLEEWLRKDIVYSEKVSHLLNGGGQNGASAFNNTTLFDDGDVDVLIGGAELDWFIAAANDRIFARAAARETLTPI